ncbi:unnamed protein product [Schistosoma curassoni]|uniref:Ubiquitin-like domain-containing protein n=1 Tax=Schistosoma curassoni TaxID=6186 RepID=A0A183KAL7_9TREM|nr:unnamed protein product [Schistosoma curassoni]
MKVELFDNEDRSLGQLVGDDKPLYDFGIENGMHIHVADPTIQDGAYDQVEEPVETYQISAEEYAKREGTLIIVVCHYQTCVLKFVLNFTKLLKSFL